MIHTLEADSIRLSFGERHILSDIYIKCKTGKITGLLGRNGEGKSCLMQIIYGSLPCERSVRIDHQNLSSTSNQARVMVYLPQFNFIPKRFRLARVFADFELDISLFQKAFPEFIGRKHALMSGLSGGEFRIVELYLVIKSKSQFAILDEPFTHLNPLQIEKAKTLLFEEKTNKGILITDHMFRNVMEVADELYVLAKGKTHLISNEKDIETLGYART